MRATYKVALVTFLALVAALVILALPQGSAQELTVDIGYSAALPAPVSCPPVDLGVGPTCGPLTHIWIGNKLGCQVAHTLDGNSYEWYPSSTIPGDCGTFLWTGSTLYTPDFDSRGSATGSLGATTPFTPVSQVMTTYPSSTLFGQVTNVATTVVTAGSLTITEVDSYTSGNEHYRTNVTIKNDGSSSATVILYRAGDCYLQGNDASYGFKGPQPGAIGCSENPGNQPPGRIEQFIPNTDGSNYYEANYNSVWAWIGGHTEFPDTCTCSSNLDSGAGLSWRFTIEAGETASASSDTRYSPEGNTEDIPDEVLPVEDPCSYATAHALDGAMVPFYGGGSFRPRWFEATYLEGALKRFPTYGWDVQYPTGSADGFWIVNSQGSSVHFMPGRATDSLTQAEAEASNAGASSVFYWTGGPIYLQHRDSNFLNNAPGIPEPTWKICPAGSPPPTPPPAPLLPPPDPVCSPAAVTVLMGVSTTLGATGGTGEFEWSAPDGNPSSGSGPSHTVTYNVPGTYTVTVQSGPQLAHCDVVVVPPPPPTSKYTVTDASPECGPRTVAFQDASIGSVVGWAWEFGDGGTSVAPSPTHDYAEGGSYEVRLTVTDSEGQSASHASWVTVADEGCVSAMQSPQQGIRSEEDPRDGSDAALAGQDVDEDGIADAEDLCPVDKDPDQDDLDGDALGDLCDPDLDGDTVANGADNCPDIDNAVQVNLDSDLMGDACDDDLDGDGVDNPFDNCQGLANASQADGDGDGLGDACEIAAEIEAEGAMSRAAFERRVEAVGTVAGATQATAPPWMGIAAAGVLGVAFVTLLAVRGRRN